MGSQRVGHNWTTTLSLFHFFLCYWQRTRLKATKLSSTIIEKHDFPSKMLLSFISVSAQWLPLPITPSACIYLSINVHSPWYYICLWTYLGLGFSSVQSLSHIRLFATPWIAACQASLSITSSWSSLRLTSIESVMLSCLVMTNSLQPHGL